MSAPKINEKELRKLLLSRKPEDAARLAEWHNLAPREEVIAVYAEVAKKGAGAGSPAGLWMLLAQLPQFFRTFKAPEKGIDWFYVALFVVLFTLYAAVWVVMRRLPQAAWVAANWLVFQGERQGILPLTTLWNPTATRDAATEAYDHAFRKLLEESPGKPDFKESEALQKMVDRAFTFSQRLSGRDFSDSAADVLLAALGCLAKAPMTNDSILRRVARFPAPASCPNRVLLREMAILFVEKPKPHVPLQRPITTAPVTPTTAQAQVAVPQRRG